MTFHDTQLGRYGQLCSMYFGMHGIPDLRAAHALASDGLSNPSRPDLKAVLGTKMFLDPIDPLWQPWGSAFSAILSKYHAKGGSPLSGRCTKSWSPLPAGFCIHELTPPLHYWSLRSFASRMKGTTILTRDDGTIGINPSAKPLWNYVITAVGEILVGSEDFEWIKHTSLAGGLNVWTAGQIGLENDELRLVDLQSGHYVGWAILPHSKLASELTAFTEAVFREYCNVFGLPLHSSFKCIWG